MTDVDLYIAMHCIYICIYILRHTAIWCQYSYLFIQQQSNFCEIKIVIIDR